MFKESSNYNFEFEDNSKQHQSQPARKNRQGFSQNDQIDQKYRFASTQSYFDQTQRKET